MSLEYEKAKARGMAAGFTDGLEGFREPFPKTKIRAEYAGYAAGYDIGFRRGYQKSIDLLLEQYMQECVGPPDPRLLKEIQARQNHQSFLTPEEIEEGRIRIPVQPSFLKEN